MTSLAMLGVGYVLGAKAGRERYAQIMEALQKASQDAARYRVGGKPSEKLAAYLSDTVDRANHSS